MSARTSSSRRAISTNTIGRQPASVAFAPSRTSSSKLSTSIFKKVGVIPLSAQ